MRMMTSHKTVALPSANDVVSEVFSSLKKYGHLAGQIPSEDYDYHHTFPAFRAHVNTHVGGLVNLMQSCTRILPERRQVKLTPEANSSGALTLPESQRVMVMDAMDSLLESVDTILDDVRGRKLHAAEQLGVVFGSSLGSGTDGTATEGGRDSAPERHDHGRHTRYGGLSAVTMSALLPRPQLAFATPVDNSASPFIPVYHDAQDERHVGQPGVHPFEDIIRSFHVPYRQLAPHAEVIPIPLKECPLHWVESVEALHAMVTELRGVSEIAVDLEHHDYYSYQGFTCLMQISTRTSDYIVDCLRLRAEMHALAPVMLDPQILKVLHGAREDVRWLQKDFGLYLVNFFDTGIALQTLHMPYSLAFAVDHFCQVRLDKKYQTADWRIRPLPAEMITYARLDTHYLLYIYDRLCALLLNNAGQAATGSSLLHVYHDSRRLSLELYEKPLTDTASSYKNALGRSLGGLTAAQHEVARDVFNWRDARAREVDESPAAVMTLAAVLTVASKMPATVSELLRCCHPISAVTRGRIAELFGVVQGALGITGGSTAMAHTTPTTSAEDVTAGADTTTSLGAGAPVLNGVHDTVAPSGSEGDRNTKSESRNETRRARHTDSGAAMCYGPVVHAGVHRPMTGTLPSIESVVGPPLVVGATPSSTDEEAHHGRRQTAGWGAPGSTLDTARAKEEDTMNTTVYNLTHTAPSRWLQQMRRLSRALTQRPDYTRMVPLPGLWHNHAAASHSSHAANKDKDGAEVDQVMSAAAASEEAVGVEEGSSSARPGVVAKSDEQPPSAVVGGPAHGDADSSAATATVGAVSTVTEEEGVAVAMRQAYGSPVRKRRRK